MRNFDRYRVDSNTPMTAEYFNEVHEDIDLRVHTVEEKAVGWDEAISNFEALGLSRLNDVLTPISAQILDVYNGIKDVADLGAIFTASSATSNQITTGQKFFVIDAASRARFAPAAFVSIYTSDSPAQGMLARVSSYNRANGTLSVLVEQTTGSGTFSSWIITPSIEFNANLNAIAQLSTTSNKLIYATGAATFAQTDLTAFGRTMLAQATASDLRGVIGAAPLASPVFSGSPTAPTPDSASNNTQIATTAFVKGLLSGSGSSGYTKLEIDDLLAVKASKSANLSDLASVATARLNLGLGNVENTALSTWSGTANITTLGTVATGTWNATAIAVAKGGTGATDAATARANLGLAIGTNVQAYDADLSAIAALSGTSGLLKKTADNTWSLDTTAYGTVSSVSGAGTVSGLTLTGTVTSTGSLTLGGTLSVAASNFSSQTANTVLAAPNGAPGVPTFRALVASDIPVLNQNTTGTASNVTGTVALANGGTGATTAASARTNLGLAIGSNVQAWDADLDAIAGLSGTAGLLKKTAANTWTLDTTAYGTVSSVSGTGTVSGLTLSGTVTTSGNLTLGGTLSVSPSNFSSQTAATFLAAPNGTAGVPTFRAIVAADIPTLNQNTTGTASNVTGTVAVANGGTGATTLTGYIKGAGASALTASATIPGSDISGNISGNAANVTGTVAVANGGTGLTSLTAGYIPFGSGTSALGSSANLFWDKTNNQLDIGAGTASLPSLSTVGDNNTGLYFPAADTVAVTTGGSERLRVSSTGSVGIGATAMTQHALRISKSVTGAATSYGATVDGTIQSDVSAASFVLSSPSTQAASFTLTTLNHFVSQQGSIGAGSTIATQSGFVASSSLVGAANNYGFFSNIPAGVSRTITTVDRTSNVVTITTSVAHGYSVGQSVTVAATTNTGVNGTFVIASAPTTTTFTYEQTAADIASGADTGSTVVVGRWNFYAAGTAPNLMAGALYLSSVAGQIPTALTSESNFSRLQLATGSNTLGASGLSLVQSAPGSNCLVFSFSKSRGHLLLPR